MLYEMAVSISLYLFALLLLTLTKILPILLAQIVIFCANWIFGYSNNSYLFKLPTMSFILGSRFDRNPLIPNLTDLKTLISPWNLWSFTLASDRCGYCFPALSGWSIDYKPQIHWRWSPKEIILSVAFHAFNNMKIYLYYSVEGMIFIHEPVLPN